MDTLKDRIAEKVKTFYNTMGEAKAELLVNKVANRIAVIRVKTLGENLTEVCRIRQLATHCQRSRPRHKTTNWLKGKQGSLLRHCNHDRDERISRDFELSSNKNKI